MRPNEEYLKTLSKNTQQYIAWLEAENKRLHDHILRNPGMFENMYLRHALEEADKEKKRA